MIKINIADVTVTLDIAVDPNKNTRVSAVLVPESQSDIVIKEPQNRAFEPVGHWLPGAN